MQGTFEEVFFHWLNISFKSQDKWWESFDKLIDQRNLNWNKWENQQVVHIKEQGTCDTDNGQDEGVNGLNKEDGCDSANIINDPTTFKENFWNIIEV